LRRHLSVALPFSVAAIRLSGNQTPPAGQRVA